MGRIVLVVALIAIWTAPALADDPKTVADWIKLAQQKETDDDDEGAYNIYSEIIRQFPKDFPEVYVMRADVQQRHGMERGQIADLEKALALDKDPKNPILNHKEIYDDLGEAKLDVGDEKGAIAAFTIALKSDPKDRFLISKRGEAKFYFGDCTGAAADYSQAIALADKPDFLDYVGRGMAHICLGELADATGDYRSATALTEANNEYSGSKNLTEWDLTAWAVTARFAGREEADKVLSRRMSEANEPTATSTDYDAARVFLGQADLSVLAADAAAIKAKNNDKSDTWDSDTYYYGGLKEMIDGHDAAAVADFEKVLRLHSAFIDMKPLSRAWIKEIRRHPHKN